MTISYAGEVPNGSSFGCFWRILCNVGSRMRRFAVGSCMRRRGGRPSAATVEDETAVHSRAGTIERDEIVSSTIRTAMRTPSFDNYSRAVLNGVKTPDRRAARARPDNKRERINSFALRREQGRAERTTGGDLEHAEVVSMSTDGELVSKPATVSSDSESMRGGCARLLRSECI
ncbi:hypothetical protein EVAR_70372_1 [Eumeta japonica]|uniref:Uncharacterized protein n=1 Tax=Eumeta variegata TaxID=151549 RepID=A0A4C1SKI7_EUMVA|nr:hypothetical protein EVAR_70372_1 [Eumeta japonica]